jgi:hypothetical protein
MVRRVFPIVIVLLSASLVASGSQSQSIDHGAPVQSADQTADPPIGSIGFQFQTGNQPLERVSKIVAESVVEDGPAGKAGLKAGDTITSVDGRAVGNGAEFVNAIRAHAIGSTTTIGYVRNGQPFEANVAVVGRNELWTTWLTKGSEAEQSAGELEQNGAPLTLRQAITAVVTGFQSSPIAMAADPVSFKFAFDSFEFNAKYSNFKGFQHYQVDLTTLPQVFPKRGFGGVYRLKDGAGNDLPKPLDHLWWHPHYQHAQENAELVANALNRLRRMASDNGIMAPRNFPQAAAVWSTLSPKPPIPEAVREQRLLAETAFKEEKLADALYHYEKAVEIDPVWPEGRFNAALIAAELQFYDEAVEHMRAYLQLLPEAPDAQAARDQVVIWQDKFKQLAASLAKNTEQSQSGLKKRK